MKRIRLNCGHHVLCDDDDYSYLKKFNWSCINNHNYAARGGRKRTLMHRVIMNAKKGQMIDHVNGKGRDNRKSNLRFCTLSQNAANQKIKKHRHKGVVRHQGKFQAQTKYNRKSIYIGLFNTIKEAVLAYDLKLMELHGAYARTNLKRTRG